MQLGTRWSVGATPPANLPQQFLDAVASVEWSLQSLDTTNWRWTLTWLERRPVAELDDGTIIRVGHDGVVVVEEPS